MRLASLCRAITAVIVGGVLLAGCGGNNSQVVWRNITVTLPDGWVVVEGTTTNLVIASMELTAPDRDTQPATTAQDAVAMYFSYEPDTLPRDVEAFLQDNGAQIESAQQRTLADDIPSTQLVYRLTDDLTDSREMVVLIPSRGVVILAQPVVRTGEADGPDVFLRQIDEFLRVVDELTFGAPVTD